MAPIVLVFIIFTDTFQTNTDQTSSWIYYT